MTTKTRKNSLLTIRIILGFIFLASGIGKLIDSGYVNYDLIRLLSTTFYWIIEYAAAIIISISLIELLVAMMFLWGKKIKWAFSVSLLMLMGFSSVLGYFYLQGMNVASCGCFGAFGFSSGLEFTLIRNGVMMLLTIAGLVLLNKKEYPAKESTTSS